MTWENLIGMGFLLNSNPTPNVFTFCAFIKRKWFWTLYINENKWIYNCDNTLIETCFWG
jgi:hypothetical protein